MSGNVKSAFVFISLSLFLFGCNQQPKSIDYYNLNNRTMGTEYNIILETKVASASIVQNEVDSLLNVIEDAVSVYRPESYITEVNRSYLKRAFKLDLHFLAVYNKAKAVYEWSNGSYDPTVMPIVRYIGFANNKNEERAEIDEYVLDSLSNCVGLDQFSLLVKGDSIYIDKVLCQELDFGAIAKGYAVDEVANLLEERNVLNYLVEIGGETRSKGVGSNGQHWRIGIDRPMINDQKANYPFAAIYSGEKKGMATSGNYRNFFVKDGKKYVHTIDPTTGRSTISDVLSATILQEECAYADGLATACMVMGSEKCLSMINDLPNTEALLIVSKTDSSFECKSSENGLEGFELLN